MAKSKFYSLIIKLTTHAHRPPPRQNTGINLNPPGSAFWLGRTCAADQHQLLQKQPEHQIEPYLFA